MVKVELSSNTLSVLIAGLYCVYHNVDSIAVPESVYLYVAEQLEYFLPNWNYEIISFEDWVKNCLTILPKAMLVDEDIQYLKENTLYTEMMNGNAPLIVSMDIRSVNANPK